MAESKIFYKTNTLETKYDANGTLIMHFILTPNDPDCTIENFIADISEKNPTQHSSFLLGHIEIANAYNSVVTFCYPHSSDIFQRTMKLGCHAIGNLEHAEYIIEMEGGFNG